MRHISPQLPPILPTPHYTSRFFSNTSNHLLNAMRKLYTLFALIPIITIAGLHAQITVPCGVPPATFDERRMILDEIASLPLSRNDETRCIPVQAYLFSRSDHAGAIDETALNTSLFYLNQHFKIAGIQFFWADTPIAVADDDLYDFNMTDSDMFGADHENEMVDVAGQRTDAINLYFFNSITLSNGMGTHGFAYYPGNAIATNRIYLKNAAIDEHDNGTVVHEFGHYFGLLHTHEGTIAGANDSQAENVSREGDQSNCQTAGDLICDTDADPGFDATHFDFYTCTYEGIATDRFGMPYTPQTGNIMSYYPDLCGGYFTQGQIERIQQGLEARLAATFYTLNSLSGGQQAPSFLQLAYLASERQVSLSWTNPAGANTGYLVERADDGETFTLLPGGVTDFSATAFLDTQVEPGMTYTYRLRPTNGTCYVYSGHASLIIPSESCTPETTGPMGNTYIDLFRIKQGTQILLLNNSAYHYAGYSDFTDEPVKLTADAPLQIMARAHETGDLFTPQHLAVWVDLNGDQDFTDAGELLMQLEGSIHSSLMSGELVLPSGINAGYHRLRMRSAAAPEMPSDPCMDYASGETEDYMLLILETDDAENPTASENAAGSDTTIADMDSQSDGWKVYPNPVLVQASIQVPSSTPQNAWMTIADMNGRILYRESIALEPGINTATAPFDGVQDGLYVISVATQEQTFGQAIFKKAEE